MTSVLEILSQMGGNDGYFSVCPFYGEHGKVVPVVELMA
jgi:hypothetical protein